MRLFSNRFVLNLAVDPVPLMIVIPGSTGPLLVRVPPTCTAQLAIKRFAEFFNGISEVHSFPLLSFFSLSLSKCSYTRKGSYVSGNAKPCHSIWLYNRR
jgi:hypothetical protein